MSATTKISWADSTINAWTVCTERSAGCQNCFARELAKRYGWGNGWGKGVPRHKFKGAMKNLAWMNKHWLVCDKCGSPVFNNGDCKCGSVGAGENKGHARRIFHGDLCDIFDEEAPIELLAEWLDGMRLADRCTNLLCTKRPENFFPLFDTLRRLNKKFITEETRAWVDRWMNAACDPPPPANIILLTSVENQAMADKRIPELLKIPAACRGLSLEPLMGPVDLMKVKTGSTKFQDGWALGIGIDWLIIGCESGPRRRECKLEWIESLVEQGKAANCAVFVKQIPIDGKVSTDPNQWPAHLRIQEFPKMF